MTNDKKLKIRAALKFDEAFRYMRRAANNDERIRKEIVPFLHEPKDSDMAWTGAFSQYLSDPDSFPLIAEMVKLPEEADAALRTAIALYQEEPMELGPELRNLPNDSKKQWAEMIYSVFKARFNLYSQPFGAGMIKYFEQELGIEAGRRKPQLPQRPAGKDKKPAPLKPPKSPEAK